jgi:hypothetical protein
MLPFRTPIQGHPVVLLYGISFLLFMRRKDPDAGSVSGMTGRDYHPVNAPILSSRSAPVLSSRKVLIRDLALALSEQRQGCRIGVQHDVKGEKTGILTRRLSG